MTFNLFKQEPVGIEKALKKLNYPLVANEKLNFPHEKLSDEALDNFARSIIDYDAAQKKKYDKYKIDYRTRTGEIIPIYPLITHNSPETCAHFMHLLGQLAVYQAPTLQNPMPMTGTNLIRANSALTNWTKDLEKLRNFLVISISLNVFSIVEQKDKNGVNLVKRNLNIPYVSEHDQTPTPKSNSSKAHDIEIIF